MAGAALGQEGDGSRATVSGPVKWHRQGSGRGAQAPGPAARLPSRQVAAGSSEPQCLHVTAATGMSADRQLGQVFTGGGSPNTGRPRLFM
jgi:hypothetical protein